MPSVKSLAVEVSYSYTSESCIQWLEHLLGSFPSLGTLYIRTIILIIKAVANTN